MGLRNGEHGYGAVTKLLHWSTVLAIAAQFGVGYTMATDADVPEVDCSAVAEQGVGPDTTESADELIDRLEEECEAEQERLEDAAADAVTGAWSDLRTGDLFSEGLTGAEVHVVLGLLVLLLGVLRVLWRRTTPLPPWDPRLTHVQQRLVQHTETALLVLQFVVPLSGLLLVTVSDDLVTLHIAAHVAFFIAVATHLAMVVGKGLVPRMLPFGTPRSAVGGSVPPQQTVAEEAG